jgi:hypothetical protein
LLLRRSSPRRVAATGLVIELRERRDNST